MMLLRYHRRQRETFYVDTNIKIMAIGATVYKYTEITLQCSNKTVGAALQLNRDQVTGRQTSREKVNKKSSFSLICVCTSAMEKFTQNERKVQQSH